MSEAKIDGTLICKATIWPVASFPALMLFRDTLRRPLLLFYQSRARSVRVDDLHADLLLSELQNS